MFRQLSIPFIISVFLSFCREKPPAPDRGIINAIDLNRGQLISCGPADKQFGSADFMTGCGKKIKERFNLAINLLHSFEYNEAEKVFAGIIDTEPQCAMAYWGVAMSKFHPLWTPPSEKELKKGAHAIAVADGLSKSVRESAYIGAIAAFYTNWQSIDHKTRCLNFEKAMQNVYATYPDDKEAAVFYALALNASADPADKSFAKQKEAAKILNELYPGSPNHPGVVHYLIHTYDYPGLAQHGLAAARQYISVAPSSAHALHMPSHIFTRLGYWDESTAANQLSVAAAKCYAEAAGIKGHWDEELHGLDYLMYGYLQKGDNDSAMMQWNYLRSMRAVSPMNFKVAYAFAAIPARFVVENRMWKEAAVLDVNTAPVPWRDYPWQKAIVHLTRLLGSVHTNKLANARKELKVLHILYDTLKAQKDVYKANQVAIQMKAGEAWILLKEGKKDRALLLMEEAADMEDRTEKHPVTPGEVVPARELLGDMQLQIHRAAKALESYEQCLAKRPGRFNALYGAGIAAAAAGETEKARGYCEELLRNAAKRSSRPEITYARNYLGGMAKR